MLRALNDRSKVLKKKPKFLCCLHTAPSKVQFLSPRSGKGGPRSRGSADTPPRARAPALANPAAAPKGRSAIPQCDVFIIQRMGQESQVRVLSLRSRKGGPRSRGPANPHPRACPQNFTNPAAAPQTRVSDLCNVTIHYSEDSKLKKIGAKQIWLRSPGVFFLNQYALRAVRGKVLV